MEVKFGFIPNSQDNTAWRLRRRYRLHKGGHPQLNLVHYTRGPQARESVVILCQSLLFPDPVALTPNSQKSSHL